MSASYYGPNSISAAVYDIVEAVLRPLAPELAFYRSLAEGVATPVLEVGAGTGRIALPLAAAGHEVHALELSTAMLAIAEDKRRQLPPEASGRVHLHPGDMRAFDLGRRFDLVLAPYRTFNFLLTPADQRAFLACLRRHLTPSGRAVLDTGGPPDLEALPPAPENSRLVVALEGTNYRVGWALEGRELDVPAQRAALHVRYSITTQAGDTLRDQTETLHLRWTDPAEMPALLEACGLRLLAAYGGVDRRPAEGLGDRLWVVGRADRDPEGERKRPPGGAATKMPDF